MRDKLSLFLTRVENTLKESVSVCKPISLKLFNLFKTSFKSSCYYMSKSQQDLIIALLLIILLVGSLTFHTLSVIPVKNQGGLSMNDSNSPVGVTPNVSISQGDSVDNSKDVVGHKNSIKGSENKSISESKIVDNSFKSGVYGVEFSFNDKLKAEVVNKESGFHRGLTSAEFSEKTELSKFVGLDYSISVFVLPFVYDVNTMSAQNAGGIRVIDSGIQDYLVTSLTRDCSEDDLFVYLGSISLDNKNSLITAVELSYVSEGQNYLVYALPYVNNFLCVSGKTSIAENKSLVKDMKEIIKTLDLSM